MILHDSYSVSEKRIFIHLDMPSHTLMFEAPSRLDIVPCINSPSMSSVFCKQRIGSRISHRPDIFRRTCKIPWQHQQWIRGILPKKGASYMFHHSTDLWITIHDSRFTGFTFWISSTTAGVSPWNICIYCVLFFPSAFFLQIIFSESICSSYLTERILTTSINPHFNLHIHIKSRKQKCVSPRITTPTTTTSSPWSPCRPPTATWCQLPKR